MLSYIKGSLVEKSYQSPKGAYFIVDTHGMGFEVLSSERSVQSGPLPGETIQLFTTMVVREDAMFLVGFNTREERDLFNILQSASGVGTKVSLALLSALSVSEIAQSVVSGNHKPLTSAKGVGPKLAQKITLDLKEKMMCWRVSDTAHHAAPTFEKNDTFRDAEAVLLSLGYQLDEIGRSFQAVDPGEQSSEIILRESLRWLASHV